VTTIEAPPQLVSAKKLLAQLFAEFLAPPPTFSVTEWAEAHRILSSKDSSEPGRYQVSRTPYAREPMDCLSQSSNVEEVVLVWAAQTSKTTVGSNWLGYLIHTNPGPIMIVQPTIDMAKRYSRQRLSPMIEESPALRLRISQNRSRDDANTTLLKEFSGGFMAIAGANSAAGLRSMPVRDLFLDEIDGYPLDVDGEGDPVMLAEARQTTFSRRKRLKTSTPTRRGTSRIESAFKAGDRCTWHVPCPHCGAKQALVWGASDAYGIKYDKDDQGQYVAVRYVCRVSGCEIREHHKPQMLAGGAWVAEFPGAQEGRVRTFHLNGLYSPLGWASWSLLVEEWLAAMTAAQAGDTTLLRTFVNTRLAETFEERGETVDEHALERRAEAYPLCTVPIGGLVLTGGADLQGNRLELTVWAWGFGLESWVVDHHVIEMNPASDDDWLPVEQYFMRRYPQQWANGGSLPIEALTLDSNYQTQAVFNFIMRMQHRMRIYAGRGDNQLGSPIKGPGRSQEVSWRGQRWPAGIKQWTVGVDSAKDLLFGQLQIDAPGAGFVHLNSALPREWFEQLTSEQRVPVRGPGGTVERWIKRRARNEVLDCRNLALHAAYMLGLQNWTDAQWRRQEAAVQPPPDLFSEAVTAAPPPAKPADQELAPPSVPGRASMATSSRDW
jgi:phage terminase large subunit GpA-like protein